LIEIEDASFNETTLPQRTHAILNVLSSHLHQLFPEHILVWGFHEDVEDSNSKQGSLCKPCKHLQLSLLHVTDSFEEVKKLNHLHTNVHIFSCAES